MPQLSDLFEASAFCLGPWVERFESDFAKYLGVGHVVGVNSGTSALHLALAAAGVGPGDEVLLPSHTFVATLWAPVYLGAKPVLCDVDAVTGLIDLNDAAQRLTSKSKVIMPVHLYGQACDMSAVQAFAQSHGLTVVEDAAQAHGAVWKNQKAGSFGALSAFSFYPGKNLGAAGEAGAVATNDDALAERIRMLRNHGQSRRYHHDEIGYNYRMEGIQGLVLGEKLKHLDRWTARRIEIASLYGQGLQGLPIQLPHTADGASHVFHLYVLRHSERDKLQPHLQAAGIQSGLHYPVPLHRQAFVRNLQMDPAQGYPNSEHWANECISLPIFYGMTDSQVDRVIRTVHSFFTS